MNNGYLYLESYPFPIPQLKYIDFFVFFSSSSCAFVDGNRPPPAQPGAAHPGGERFHEDTRRKNLKKHEDNLLQKPVIYLPRRKEKRHIAIETSLCSA
jgi:hypothetical protein